jgi:hypothetical protein
MSLPADPVHELRQAVRRLALARNGLIASRGRLSHAHSRYPVIGFADEDLLSPLKADVRRWEAALEDAICGVLLAESTLAAIEAAEEAEEAELDRECRETLARDL